MYYLGIDGGGTKTKYTVADDNLEKVIELEGDTIHIHQIGIEGIKKEITEKLNIIFTELKISAEDIAYTFAGVPGYGESLDDMNQIDAAMKELFKMPYKMGNDAVNGWAAGTACKPGINIVAGTGSIAFGMNEQGKIARCGGFGPGIGDDGSAYWIGLRVINEYTKQKDGRAEKTMLTDLLEQKYSIGYEFEIVDIVFNRLKFNRTDIAKFSMICAEAANKGCTASKNIFEEAANEIFAHVKVLAKKLNFKNGFVISYTGGVFNAGDLILNPLIELINESGLKCKLQEPQLEPWDGAVLLAYKLAGNKVPDNIREIFK
jgi:N-acetylglucosamine kinase-like BadF-type ATPase